MVEFSHSIYHHKLEIRKCSCPFWHCLSSVQLVFLCAISQNIANCVLFFIFCYFSFSLFSRTLQLKFVFSFLLQKIRFSHCQSGIIIRLKKTVFLSPVFLSFCLFRLCSPLSLSFLIRNCTFFRYSVQLLLLLLLLLLPLLLLLLLLLLLQ